MHTSFSSIACLSTRCSCYSEIQFFPHLPAELSLEITSIQWLFLTRPLPGSVDSASFLWTLRKHGFPLSGNMECLLASIRRYNIKSSAHQIFKSELICTEKHNGELTREPQLIYSSKLPK